MNRRSDGTANSISGARVCTLRTATLLFVMGVLACAVAAWLPGAARAAAPSVQEVPVCVMDGVGQSYPDISGSFVVWYDGRNGATSSIDVYGKDLSSGAEFPVTTAAGRQWDPAISGDLVVFEDSRTGDFIWDIYGKDLSNGSEFPICTASGNQNYPDVSGSLVAWWDLRGATPAIYAKDLSSGAEFPVDLSASWDIVPSVSGDVIVWTDSRDESDAGDIYGYDVSSHTEFPICVASGWQKDPQISGDIVVWSDDRNGTWDVYGKDLSNGQEFAICTAPGDQRGAAVSGATVVWVDSRSSTDEDENSDIYGKDLASGEEFAICTAPGNQGVPKISGNTVVWDDARNASRDIYGAKLSWPTLDTTPPTTTASGASSGAWYNTARTITFSAIDNEGGSGIAATEYRLDAGDWTAGAGVTVAAPSDHSNDGAHTVSYRSSDLAGNVEATKAVTVRIDTLGPRTYATHKTGYRAHTVKLRYKIADTQSETATGIVIVVKNSAGKTVKRFAPTPKAMGVWHSVAWVPSTCGVYRYYVYAKDLAGNQQRLRGSGRQLVVVHDPIRFGTTRRTQMKSYSLRRYGDYSVDLRPKVVVLHYTAGGTYRSVWSYFNSNVPNGGERPGVVTQFIVDRDGTVYQLLSNSLRGRHAVGLNHVAIGIEFVQDAGYGDTWATNQILARRAQANAGLNLVRQLQAEFGIPTRHVIGHAMANGSPYFKDLSGRRNDHGDWGAAAVARFRARL